jgi:HEAT repeat protein
VNDARKDEVLSSALGRLESSDPGSRALAADDLSDYFRCRAGSDDAVARAVACLVEVAVTDDEEAVREATLHACGEAISYHELPLGLFLPLVPLMSGLSAELVGYVLGILGSTHDSAARPLVAPYVSHADSSVREEAAEALVELAGRST